MKTDPPATLLHLGPDLEQLPPQRARLGARKPGARKRLLQHADQKVGRMMQQQPELVGEEPMATRSPGREVVLPLLDTVLPVPAGTVEAIDGLQSLSPAAGEDRADVQLSPDGFHLRDHSLDRRPTVSLVEESREQTYILAGALGLPQSLLLQRGGLCAQTRVAAQRQPIGEPFVPTEGQHIGVSEARVRSQSDLHVREAISKQADRAPQQSEQADFGCRVA